MEGLPTDQGPVLGMAVLWGAQSVVTTVRVEQDNL